MTIAGVALTLLGTLAVWEFWRFQARRRTQRRGLQTAAHDESRCAVKRLRRSRSAATIEHSLGQVPDHINQRV